MTSQGDGRGADFSVVTRLIPELKFTCRGTIVQVTYGGRRRSGVQDPKIQIWRESQSQCGAYFKPVPDIALNGSVCNGGMSVVSPRVFRCALKEAFRVSVEPDDILGLELPPTDDEDFELYFKNGGPTNYVFNNQILGTVVLSSRSTEVQEQLQINIDVESDTISPQGIEMMSHSKLIECLKYFYIGHRDRDCELTRNYFR